MIKRDAICIDPQPCARCRELEAELVEAYRMLLDAERRLGAPKKAKVGPRQARRLREEKPPTAQDFVRTLARLVRIERKRRT